MPEPMSPAEVARELGITPAQVRKIEREALFKLFRLAREWGWRMDQFEVERPLPADHFHTFRGC